MGKNTYNMGKNPWYNICYFIILFLYNIKDPYTIETLWTYDLAIYIYLFIQLNHTLA